MKKKSIAVLSAAILVMSATPVFAASSSCPTSLADLKSFSCASLVESCNNYLTNLQSNFDCGNESVEFSYDGNFSDSIKSYLESCGFTEGTNCTITDLTNSDTDCTGPNCNATEDTTDCTGPNCNATEDTTDCTGPNCNATEDTTDCTGPNCNATEDTTDCTGPNCNATEDTTDTDVVIDNSTDTDTTTTTDTTDKVNDNTASNSAVAESQYISEVIRLVNVERAKEGLSALTTNSTIQSAAQVRAQEIVSTFSHTRPNGSSCFTALDQAGVSYSGAGENIAYGQPTPAAVVDAWMNSPGHRANIMNANFTTIGVGCYQSGSTYYWSQFFTY